MQHVVSSRGGWGQGSSGEPLHARARDGVGHGIGGPHPVPCASAHRRRRPRVRARGEGRGRGEGELTSSAFWMYSASLAWTCAFISSSNPASSKYEFASSATYGYRLDAIEIMPANTQSGAVGTSAAKCHPATDDSKAGTRVPSRGRVARRRGCWFLPSPQRTRVGGGTAHRIPGPSLWGGELENGRGERKRDTTRYGAAWPCKACCASFVRTQRAAQAGHTTRWHCTSRSRGTVPQVAAWQQTQQLAPVST